MNNKKGTRTSKYADADASFVYDSFRTYTHDDFAQLSFARLLGISKILQVRSAKQYSKIALINAIVQKHTNRVHGLSNDETKEHEETKGYEETKDHEETSIVETSSQQVASDALSFTEQVKQKFMEIRHYRLGDNIWFHANSVASYLEYQDCRKAVYTSVDSCDKICYEDLISQVRATDPDLGNLQPETIFINQDGVFNLTMRSKMPLAKQFRKWLIREVIPSIIDTGAYVSPAMTQQQLVELQARVQTIKMEKQQADVRAQAFEAENQRFLEQLETEA